MKITGIKVHLAREWQTFLFVQVETDENISGIRESGITGRFRRCGTPEAIVDRAGPISKGAITHDSFDV